MYFYCKKGIASIPNHLEIPYYIYDYFSFLSNPTTTTKTLCHVKCARPSYRISIQNSGKMQLKVKGASLN